MPKPIPMQSFSDTDQLRHVLPNQVIGNADAVRSIATAIGAGRLSRSLMLCGPTGVGRKSMAFRLAAGFASGGRYATDFAAPMDNWPQVEAKSARLLAQGAHPDVLVLEGEGAKQEISAKAARQLQQFQATTPALGKGKVAIITNANALNKESANAILKVLEEPKKSMALILVASEAMAILPTIRSRCAQFLFRRLEGPEIEQILAAHGLALSGHHAALVDGDASLALALASAEVDLAILDEVGALIDTPGGRLPPKVGPGLVALEKSLGLPLAIRLVLRRLRSSILRQANAGSANALGVFERRMKQRETLSLDSTASWMDALGQMRAMLHSH